MSTVVLGSSHVFHEQTAVAEVWVKSTKNGRLSLTMEDGR